MTKSTIVQQINILNGEPVPGNQPMNQAPVADKSAVSGTIVRSIGDVGFAHNQENGPIGEFVEPPLQ